MKKLIITLLVVYFSQEFLAGPLYLDSIWESLKFLQSVKV